MTLPDEFVHELCGLCRRFLNEAHLPVSVADALVGKAGRMAHVLPLARPFVARLYAAMSASLDAIAAGAREAPPGEVACCRFRAGAVSVLQVLGLSGKAPVPHSRDVFPADAAPSDPLVRRLEVDASPWGAGGILFENDVAVECFSLAWDTAFFEARGVYVGDTAYQTYFEVLVLLLAVERWCDGSAATTVFGDNAGALQEALDLKGRGSLLELAQLLAVLRGARSVEVAVAHYPTESNVAADALSRQSGPVRERKAWPFRPDHGVKVVEPIGLEELWAWLSP